MPAAAKQKKTQETQSLTPDRVREIEAMYAKKGRIVRIPTLAEIKRRHEYTKAWWAPRDQIIRAFTSMARLESPFDDDKESVADKKVRLAPSGRVEYSTAPFPFDVVTLSQSLVEDRYPYTTILPADKAHLRGDTLGEFDMFAQACLDNQLEQSDFKSDMIVKAMVTGWLVSHYTFDPQLMEHGQFPFGLQILDPLDFYPHLNAHKQPIWATVVNRVTGAQLLEDYGSYQGVKEMFADEPESGSLEYGSSAYNRYWEHGNNIYTTEFDIIRFWDEFVTVLLVGATDASTTACNFNPTLKYLAQNSRKGKYAAVLDSADPNDDNPFAGIFLHNMGQIPVSIEGCWPEPVGPHSKDLISGGLQAGRVGWFPFMYSQLQTWMDTSQIDSMLHTIMMDAADPQLFTNSPSITSANVDSKLLRGVDAEDAKWLTKPPISQEYVAWLTKMEGRSQAGLFGAGAYGAAAGTSGRQQSDRREAGTSRLGKLLSMVKRASASYPRAIGKTMVHRGGDEKLFVAGNGSKYLTGSYAREFKFDGLNGVVPRIQVQLLEENGLKNAENVAYAKSLQGFLPKKYIWRNALDIVNAEQLWQDERDEAIEMDKNVNMPRLEIATLKAQKEAGKEKAKLSWEVQQMNDEIQHENDVKQTKLDLSQLSEEELIARQKAFIEKKMQEASQPQTSQGTMGSPTQTPGQGSGPFSMPPSGGPTTMPPPIPGPGLGSGVGMPLGQAPSPGLMSPRPMMPMNAQPPGMTGPGGLPSPADIGRRVATAPGQAEQPIQTAARFQPVGGVGTGGGVPSILRGAQGLPGQPAYLPNIEAANQAVRPIGPIPAPTLGNQRNGRRKRGRRG